MIELPESLASASDARHFVAERCRTWGLGVVCEDLVLPVNELVTNSVLHARSWTTVTISLTEAYVEVAVRDASPRPPIVRPVRVNLDDDIRLVAGRLSELPEDLRHNTLHVGNAGSIAAGRGMHVVDAVADEWGVSELADGKNVWFRLATPSGWTPASRCRCRTKPTAVSPGGLSLHLST